MQKPETPANERQRLAALTGLSLLDTPDEERFDRFTRLARRLFDVPIALVTLVDANRQWFKSKQGLDTDETPRDVSFCGHAILDCDPLVISDASRDQRFADNPLVIGEPNIKFYAGYPLADRSGQRLGTLCIIDRAPRKFDDSDMELLLDLGKMVEVEMLALELVTVDELTGISNRRGFMRIAEKVLAVCARNNTDATLLYFDLDDFKQINDRFGHGGGDEVLVEFAELLIETFRDSDVVARLGGDEFCVLLTGSGERMVERPLQDLSRRVDQRNRVADAPAGINFSVGVTKYESSRHQCITDLLSGADAAMYRDKRRVPPESETVLHTLG